MRRQYCSLWLACAMAGLATTTADSGPGPVVDPGEVSTYYSVAPEEHEWEEAFYETYNFTATDFSDAFDPRFDNDAPLELPLPAELGEDYDPSMAPHAIENATFVGYSDGALRVASYEALGCPLGCWVPVHRLPRECGCVVPQCDDPAQPDACYVCQRGFAVYRSWDECMLNGEPVEDEGLTKADYPQQDAVQDDDLSVANINALCASDDEIPYPAWEPELPAWALGNDTEVAGRKLLQSKSICPHLQSGLSRWEDKSTWGGWLPQRGWDITIPAGKRVLISACSLRGMADPYFRKIYVPENSELIFADTNLKLSVSEIWVEGALRMGAPKCRLSGKIHITFKKYAGMYASNFGINTGRKSTIDIHGRMFFPTWTRLAVTAKRGSTQLTVQANVNTWQQGHRIVLVSTIWKDLNQNQNEVLVIKRVKQGGRVIELQTPLRYDHYGGPEYQAEVGLLSRSIQLLGTGDSADWGYANEGKISPMGPSFGPHLMFTGKVARLSGVYVFGAGQTNQLGRYAVHFHMMGNQQTTTAFLKDSTVHNSNFRCVAVHGTHGVLLQNNVGFMIQGNCFYLETGVEERNIFDRNLAAYIIPINPMGGWGQGGDTRVEGDQGIIEPTDSAAAAFYGTNTFNTWTNNAGSGGFFVYSFPALPRCIREFASDPNCKPSERPFQRFDRNTAHSAGYLWEHGSCLYTGGSLVQRGDKKLVYNSGRDTKDGLRRTKWMNGNSALKVTNFKAFLCQVGVTHWGERMEITGYEAHDFVLSAQMLGDSMMKNAIVNMRTPNRAASMDTPNYWDMARTTGFSWYDTGTRTLLSNVEFRNFRMETSKIAYHRSAIFSGLTHSDFFSPQVMSYTKGLKFAGSDYPGVLLRLDKYDSNSYRYFQWIDLDGTATGWRAPAIIGSEPSFSAVGDSCTYLDANPSADNRVFMCKTNTKLARLDFHIPGVTTLYDDCCGVPSDSSKYGLGLVYQMGYTGTSMRWTAFTRNTGTVGPTGKNGWYYAFKGNACPKNFRLYATQVPVDSPVYVAVRFPRGTTFSVVRTFRWYSYYNRACRKVNSRWEMMRNDDSDGSCMYHFDGNVLYLKISEVKLPQASPWAPWRIDGESLITPRYVDHWFEVTSSLNCGQPMCNCNVQPAVPPAVW